MVRLTTLACIALLVLAFAPKPVIGNTPIHGMYTNHHGPHQAEVRCLRLLSHGPIEIMGNEAFASQGWPGNGTEDDPYRIEGLNITTMEALAIGIWNTSAHFVIRDCFLSCVGNQRNLVQWTNVTHGTIDACSLVTPARCFFASHCTYMTVRDTDFSAGGEGGWIEYCDSLVLERNNVLAVDWGFHLEIVSNMNVTENHFVGCAAGVYVNGASQTEATENTFTDGMTGMFIYPGAELFTVKSNKFENLTSAAIWLSTSLMDSLYHQQSNATVGIVLSDNAVSHCEAGLISGGGSWTLFKNNTVVGCDRGVVLSDSAYIQIINNTIVETSSIAVTITNGATGHRIFGNVITGSGVHNALDDSGNTEWDDGISMGNTWDDYDGYGVYSIPGSAGSVDRWPERTGPPFLWIENETEIVAGTTNNNLVWTAYDSQPSSFELFKNGTMVDSDIWYGGNITTSLDELEAGVYNYSMVVMNLRNESSRAWTLVRVIQPSTSSLSPVLMVVASIASLVAIASLYAVVAIARLRP